MTVTQDTRVSGRRQRLCQLILVFGDNPSVLRIVDQAIGSFVDGEEEERANIIVITLGNEFPLYRCRSVR